LPEKLTIDISRLAEVNTLVTVGDIKVDQKKVKILADSGELVAKIGPLEKEEIVTPPPVGEAAPAEGAPAEGAPTEEGAETPAEEVPTTTEEKPAEEKNK
jgi:hypothetical protein